MDTVAILYAFLKKKQIIAGSIENMRKSTSTEKCTLRKADDLFVRDKILKTGTVLLEDRENHYYLFMVKCGLFNNVLAYSIIQRNGNDAEISVYVREGIIKQNLSNKVMSKLLAVFG